MAQQGLFGLQESWVGWTDSRASRTSVLRLSSHHQARAPSACLGSAELLLWPGQAPRVVSTSILLLAHGGRCPQALGPEQGPRTSGSSGPSPCRDRKGVRKPRGKAAAHFHGLWLWALRVGMGDPTGGSSGRLWREGGREGSPGGLCWNRGGSPPDGITGRDLSPIPVSSPGKCDHSSLSGAEEMGGEVPKGGGLCVLSGGGQRRPHGHISAVFICLGPVAY